MKYYSDILKAIISASQAMVCVQIGPSAPCQAAIEEGLKDNFNKGGGQGELRVYNGDYYKAFEDYEDGRVSLLHVDMPTDEEVIRAIIGQWDRKMTQGGIIIFHGGLSDSNPSIKSEIESNAIIEKNYVFGTYMRCGGLSCFLKKR